MDDDWVLPPSDEEVASPVQQARRRLGRPPGIRGSAAIRQARDECLEEAGVAVQERGGSVSETTGHSCTLLTAPPPPLRCRVPQLRPCGLPPPPHVCRGLLRGLWGVDTCVVSSWGACPRLCFSYRSESPA